MSGLVLDNAGASTQTFLNQGVLGAVCVLLILAVGFLAWFSHKIYQDRVADMKQLIASQQQTTMASAEVAMDSARSMETTLNGLQNAIEGLESQVKAFEQSLVSKYSQIHESVRDADRTMRDLKEQQIRIEVAMARRGGRDA